MKGRAWRWAKRGSLNSQGRCGGGDRAVFPIGREVKFLSAPTSKNPEGPKAILLGWH